MATLKDVAKLAAVDVSTVSRALNNTSYVHPETKKRILAAVEKLSYRPNLLAKGLRQGKRHTLGVVVPRLHLTVFSTIAQSIEEAARKRGYATILCSTEDDAQSEKEGLSRLRNGLVDGIIIAATSSNKKILNDIRATGIAVTQIIRMPDKNLPAVLVDYEKCGYDAVIYLHKKGCTHIGLINGPIKTSPYKKRYAGYHIAMQELGLTEITTEMDAFTNSLQYGYECTKQLLMDNPKLDAIMAAVDAQGIGALRALKEAGKRVPEDVKVISLTGHDIGNMLEITLTSMEMPAREIGRQAAQLTIEAIEADSKEPIPQPHVIYTSELVEREST